MCHYGSAMLAVKKGGDSTMSMAKIRECQQAFRQAEKELEKLYGEKYRIEERYIAEKGIVNPDGTVPRNVLDIDDDDEFIEVDAVCFEFFEKIGLMKKFDAAEQALREARDNLIANGLDMLPKEYRAEKESLERAMQKSSSMREKVIDLILRLDTGQETGVKESPQTMEQGIKGMEMI